MGVIAGTIIRAFKWLTPDHHSVYRCYDYSAYLPRGPRPGEWLPAVSEVAPGRSGYHLSTIGRGLASDWCVPGELWAVDTRGELARMGAQLATGQVRLVRPVGRITRQTAAVWALDCVSHVLAGSKETRDLCHRAVAAGRAVLAQPDDARLKAEAGAVADIAWGMWYSWDNGTTEQEVWRAARDAWDVWDLWDAVAAQAAARAVSAAVEACDADLDEARMVCQHATTLRTAGNDSATETALTPHKLQNWNVREAAAWARETAGFAGEDSAGIRGRQSMRLLRALREDTPEREGAVRRVWESSWQDAWDIEMVWQDGRLIELLAG